MAHGGNFSEFARRYQKKECDIIDFSSSINPLGLPESLNSVYQNSMDDLSRYPDPYAAPLRAKIAESFSCSQKHVVVGNGSMGVLEVAVRVLAPQRAYPPHVLLVEPCFSEYRRLAELQKAHIDTVALSSEDHFKFPLKEIIKSLTAKDVLILGHPNNPTGTSLSREGLCQLLNAAEQENVWVLVDEAFSDWAPDISMASKVSELGRLVVVRSLTKFFALAGIRSGYALGPKSVINEMMKHMGPWTCNRLAQKLSIAALRDHAFQDESRRWLMRERSWFYDALQQLQILQPFQSSANFLLIQSRVSLDGFFDFLGKRGVFVRPCQNFNGLDKSYFRVAVRTRWENKLLLSVLEEWKNLILKMDRPKLASKT